MPSFNRVTLMGNLTRDPLLKQLPSSTTVAEFGLAISRRFRTQSGEDREEVCFVDCTAFGRQAETIGQYCRKGRPLLVDGRLKYDTWDDKGGGKRNKLSVVVETFQFLGRQGGEDDGPFGRQSQFGAQRTFEDRFAERRFREEDPFATGGTNGSGGGSRTAGETRPLPARASEARHGDDRPGSDARQPAEVRHEDDGHGNDRHEDDRARANDAATADAAPAERPGHAADRGNADDGRHDRPAAAERQAGNSRPSAPVRSNLRGNRSPAKVGAGAAGAEKARFNHEDIPF